jgi:hypothetical protein
MPMPTLADLLWWWPVALVITAVYSIMYGKWGKNDDHNRK